MLREFVSSWFISFRFLVRALPGGSVGHLVQVEVEASLEEDKDRQQHNWRSDQRGDNA